MDIDLPIHEVGADILSALERHTRLILEAPTGSGKSTQVPQLLADAPFVTGRIIVLQPRRMAARMLARRVAFEQGGRVGGRVGYQVRFEREVGAETEIIYATEGILLRQMVMDPELTGVGAILFDEFHERHIYGDITLARALQVQASQRPDLRIAVMSATLDAEALQERLAPVETVRSEGRTWPVEISYIAKALSEKTPIWDAAARAFKAAIPDVPDGDVLIFMPGRYEIQRTCDALRNGAASGFDIFPLHGELPNDAQDRAVAQGARRRVIVATNVAETSLTIPGVRLVIDGGLVREANFDAARSMNTLHVVPISQASAEQRAGRAGRVGPGSCVRLWTERQHAKRDPQTTPEIHRIDLAEVLLALLGTGVTDLDAFPWIDPPSEIAMARARGLLRDLGAIEEGRDTPTATGRRMVAFPLHPRYARMLLAAGERGVLEEVALLAALTQERDILIRRVDRGVESRRLEWFGDDARSDLFVRMAAWAYARERRFDTTACAELGIHAAGARRVGALRDQVLRVARNAGVRHGADDGDEHAIQKCLLLGFIDHLSCRMDVATTRCRVIHGRSGKLAKDSIVKDAALLVAVELNEIDGREREVVLSGCTQVEEAWLRELYPAAFDEGITVSYDSSRRAVVGAEQVLFRDLALRERSAPAPADAAAAILAAAVHAGRLSIKSWNRDVDEWIARVNLLAERCPEWEIPPISDEDRLALLEQVCLGATSYKAIKDRAVFRHVKSWLDPAQLETVDQYAPERVALSNGRKVRVRYGDGPPHVSARMQELFGVRDVPRIAEGRVPLQIQILGPNQRPVQITEDLAGFWTNHYPRVKREMQRRYPKHAWPEDPRLSR